nr:MAG TPA: hypothetical protein [Caudoviricetes sp.]
MGQIRSHKKNKKSANIFNPDALQKRNRTKAKIAGIATK